MDSPRYFDLDRLRPLLQRGFTLITPNLRLSRAIKQAWDREQMQAGQVTWEPAPVCALEQWLAGQWQQAVRAGVVSPAITISPLQQAELWRQVIRDDTSATDSAPLLRLDAAVDLARQARELMLRYGIDPADTKATSEFALDDDCATFLRWCRAFPVALQQQSALTIDDSAIRLLALDYSAATVPIALVDFDDIAPLHRAVVASRADPLEEVASADASAPIIGKSFAERRAELSAVARWAASQYKSDTGCRLGILLTDMQSDRNELEYLLRREFDCLGDNYGALPVDFSTGIPLDRAPVIRDALRMLTVIEPQVSQEDVQGLIISRFAACRDALTETGLKLLQALYRDGVQRISTARLRHLAATVRIDEQRGTAIGDCLKAISALRLDRRRELPSHWVEHFCQVLQIFGWPGPGPLDSLEYQQVETWYEVLEAFSGFDALSGELPASEALALLRRCCQQRISQPQTASSGIQVLGPLEAAGLQFDQVWMVGLQGSRWPAPARPNPFLPVAMQRRLSMPHSSAEREWRYATALMRQYRAGCRVLIASFSRQNDGVPEVPSALLDGVQIEQHELAEEPWRDWHETSGAARLVAQRDDNAPALSSAQLAAIRGGTAILQAQANCPFRAFAVLRLQAQPLDEPRSGLRATERGKLLHDALYALWGELQDSATLHRQDEAALHSIVNRSIDSAMQQLPSALSQLVGRGCLDLEQQRLTALLHEWLEVERAREPFTVVSREDPAEYTFAGLRLSLKLDRIDRLADGAQLVIDYKSGRSSLSSWLGERPSQPQLPLYGLIGDASGLAFAQVRARDCRMIGIGEVEGVAGVQQDVARAVQRYSEQQDWPGLLAEWRSNLERLADAFMQGEAAVDPLPAACTYCGIQALCRVEINDGGPV